MADSFPPDTGAPEPERSGAFDKDPGSPTARVAGPTCSAVVPVYNEQDSLEILCRELMAALSAMGAWFEIIFVNDGSTDETGGILESFVRRYGDRVRVVSSSRRTGQTAALKRGIDAARGEVLITLDADLQNDPADIPLLVERLKQGYDVVCGWRKARRDKPLKTFLSQLANRLQRLLSGLKIHDVSCTLRVYRRTCLAQLPLDREGEHRFIPLILSLQGYRISEIEAHHRPRRFGQSKYNHKRAFKVIADFVRILFTSKRLKRAEQGELP